MCVYFTEDYTFSDFIMVNTALHALFWACDHLAPSSNSEESQRFSLMCGRNLEVALANLPLHMPTNTESIMALLSGAMYAIEISKPSLSWVLTSKAAELCQTLGFNRIETYRGETRESARHKQFLFWAVYVMAHGLCLRFGRSSLVQDCDITIPYPTSDEPERRMVCDFTTLWVLAAKLQGEIYERLYCPKALSQPEDVRRTRLKILVRSSEEIEDLATRMMSEHEMWCKTMAGDALTEFFARSDKVLRLALLCTIHRAVPNPPGSATTFSDECVAAARATLDEHQTCMNINDSEKLGMFATYMNWTILFAPFVPFITLFANTIETLDRADLNRLRAFLTSISSREHTPESEAIIKTRRLFQVLYNVALHYVENTGRAAAAGPGSEHPPEPDGIDAYLATLGFAAQGLPDLQQQQRGPTMGSYADESQATRGVNPMLWMSTGTQLEDWFYSNEQMMDLEFALDGTEERF